MYLDDANDVRARLLSMILTERYEPPDGCVKLIVRALWELGINVQGNMLYDRLLFKKMDHGELGTLIIWQRGNPEFTHKFHIGLMLDNRYALQSSTATNGAARIEICPPPLVDYFRGFY